MIDLYSKVFNFVIGYMHEPQVKKEHYDFEKYSHIGRWASYYHQIHTTLKECPQAVLEVGVGDKVFGSFLRNNTSISYTSVDIAEDLGPDILGSVLALPFPDNSFDAVCIFEVLEHLPFKDFDKAIQEIFRVSKKSVIVSLPHFGPPIKFLLKIPFLPEIKFSLKIPFYKRHIFNGEHYFEIGKKGYSVKNIISKFNIFGDLLDHFVPFDNQYHHFFIFHKKKDCVFKNNKTNNKS